MADAAGAAAGLALAGPPALWVGAECTINRVGDVYRDQSVLTGFATRAGDVERLVGLGATAVRLPVLWERVAPDADGAADFRWPDDAIARLRDAGVRPIVGLLHHGSGPRHTSLVDPAFPTLFAAYARRVAERYPGVRDWTPINEPLTTARFACLYGLWYPHRRDDRSFVRAVLNQVRATGLAMRAIRAVHPDARLVQTDDLGFTRSTPGLADQAAFDNERRWLAFDLLAGRVDGAHPLCDWLRGHGASERELAELRDEPCPADIVGINAYVTSERFLDARLHLHPPHRHQGNGRETYADVETARAHGAPIDGFAGRLREAHARYGVPIAITEVHLGCTREEQLRWLRQAWTDACDARAEGIDVRAVTAWAAFGTVDWNSLLVDAAGHYEPGLWDVRGPEPRLTALGRLAARLGQAEPAVAGDLHPVLAGPGWWQRDLRFAVPPHGPVRARGASGAPLLILGGGALAYAVARLCHQRGLPYDVLDRAPSRAERARAGPPSSTTARPWAIVDTTGGDAADDEEVPTPRLTFSNLEAPAVAPHVLTIRVGHLFGPWDAGDAVALGLAALRRGDHWTIAPDTPVAPTYVPDVVQAALDLLIDGEHGAWHLTNGSVVALADFARRAAVFADLDPAGVVVGTTAATHRAPRCLDHPGHGALLPSLDDALARFQRDHEATPAPLPAWGAPGGR